MRQATLVDFWRSCPLDGPPYIHPEDRDLLTPPLLALESGFDQYLKSDRFWTPHDRRLHVGLLPIPYVGNLQEATVFILMLNPGLSPSDFFGESYQQKYRQAMLNNIRQEKLQSDYPFLFLDPEFSWHAGFAYWEAKLRDVALHWAKASGVSYREGLSKVARVTCCIELVPYHSREFALPRRLCERLPSARVVREFVHDALVPRAMKKEISIIVTRRVKDWGLDASENIVTYAGVEPRSAHLTVKSRGGQVVLRALQDPRGAA